MKTIKFSLPFKTEDYLHSMTEEIADQAAIKLITAKEDFFGNIDTCNISFMDVEEQSEEIFQAGVSIGAHAHAYGEQKRKEELMTFLSWLLEVQEDINEEEVKEKEEEVKEKEEEVKEVVKEEEDLSEIELVPVDNFEDDEFINFDVDIDKLSTEEAKDLLRKVLVNFKK